MTFIAALMMFINTMFGTAPAGSTIHITADQYNTIASQSTTAPLASPITVPGGGGIVIVDANEF